MSSFIRRSTRRSLFGLCRIFLCWLRSIWVQLQEGVSLDVEAVLAYGNEFAHALAAKDEDLVSSYLAEGWSGISSGSWLPFPGRSGRVK
jgi:tagatose-1,6-bisphosphate aldolase non-catalytic subunit AgaZ/GatZ